MTEDILLPFDLPAVRRKKVTADFEGGLISSDGGLVLLRGAERRLGLAERLAGCIRDWRDPALVSYTPPSLPDNAVQTTLGGRAAALTDRAVQTITPPSGPGIGGVHGKQLFYAKMTVGRDDPNEFSGYSDGTTGGATVGSLSVSSREITLAGDKYTLYEILLVDNGDLALVFTNSLTENAAANLSVYVGGTRFRFDEYDRAGDGIFAWTNSGLTWAAGQIVPVLIVDENKAPVFRFEDWHRYVFENPDGVVDVGAPVVATDPDGHAVTGYALTGRDADKFTIDENTGQIRTKADVVYDYETQGSCVVKFSFTTKSKRCFNVVVQVTDSYGAVGEKRVAVFLLNDTRDDRVVREVRAEAVAGTAGILRLSWVRPTKRPTGYEVWYGAGDIETGANTTSAGAGATRLDIPFLEADTEYAVWIRGRFDDSDTNIYYDPERGSYGQGPWTKARGRTGAAIPGAKPAASLALPPGVSALGTGVRRIVRLPVGGVARFRIEVTNIVNSHEWRARRPVGIKVCYVEHWRDTTGQTFSGGAASRCPAGVSAGLAIRANGSFTMTSATSAYVEQAKQINSAALEGGPYRVTLGPGRDYVRAGLVREVCFEVANGEGEVPSPCAALTPPPVPASASVPAAGGRVDVKFDRALDSTAAHRPAPDAFTVTVDGREVSVTGVGISGSSVRLTVSSTIARGQTVTVSYRDSGPERAIQNAAGEDAESFTDMEVTNNSEVGQPELVSATVPELGQPGGAHFQHGAR